MRRKILVAVCSLIVAAIAFTACLNSAGEGLSDTGNISYNYHVRPILSDKCFKCHGPDQNKLEAGLRLDLPEFAFAPLKETKGAFALVPGKPEESEVFKRVISTDPNYIMPTPDSHLGALSTEEIAILKKWIEQGAEYEPHWAFVKPEKQDLPKVKSALAKNEIDYFILARLKEKGLSMNEEADKERLLKRVSLDLTGLPPDEALIERFLNDKSENAYEKLVETLLAVPQYGEKMAVHWMDIARYADSYGYQDDNIRTQWPWRDWVIKAFNENMPYDQFVTWQMAGDLLPNATKEQVLATAFFRNHKYTEEGGVIPEEYRIEYVLDKTKTYTKGLLGLTAECAQCHDHKYDPISQKDYFSLFAFFNNTYEVGYEGDVSISKPAKNPILTLTNEELQSTLSFINREDTSSLYVSVMGELDTIRPTYVLNRGVYDHPTERVQPMALPVVMKYDTVQLPRNRLGLAKWTVDKNNPLTARVFVNQLWQEFFGRGLVKTSGDFGMQGELPSHPELLDWLAVDFMEHNWDIKYIIKKIVSSNTYRQSARVSEKALEKDPENIYLSHAPRTRLKAEFVRDLVLSSSGLLVKKIGGPSVKPYQPAGLWESATSGRGELATYKQDKGEKLYRRGLYTFIKLTVPPPSMILFDASNRDQCEVTRLQTNTPLQALAMMNDPTILEGSRVFAQKLISTNKDAQTNIETAFRRILCRTPEKEELSILTRYHKEQLELFRAGQLDAKSTLKVGEYPQDPNLDPVSQAALMKTINLMYNMEEAIVKS
ncbi:PSD1 and planctomycete cytochrome C domain-containing protein [Flavihumibacter sp. RY-1]|uniref:PSD1 and planctomycete cytochrome C domain-containing protein n=1 Tax=Flavihumibacter fluminis TaxID=2909236 RepID=A0ABS9BCW9_9BACT|nr:PSD1 and planctomycete cytochrome C domain-containing protein [Flavihumibacter fluminis]MCF1713532.1 PSD1 and planctomycete cytochrome C domain-containing protein [Flavihumibacter fluminis]